MEFTTSEEQAWEAYSTRVDEILVSELGLPLYIEHEEFILAEKSDLFDQDFDAEEASNRISNRI